MRWPCFGSTDARHAVPKNVLFDVRQATAELVGMTFFVFVGTGTVVTTGGNLVATALAFGIGIAVAAFSIGHVSGCHLNPAVTTSLLVSGNCGAGQALANVLAQCCGSILASLGVWALTAQRVDLGANAIADGYATWNAAVGEFVATLFLCFVVHTCTVDKKNRTASSLAPLPIGFAVLLAHCVLVPVDGCSINPARSLGPAIVAGSWNDFWVFAVAPLVGALASVPVFRAVTAGPEEVEEETV